MKRDPYLDKYIRLLEQNAARAYKDLERERKRVDFIEGKVERLELVVLSAKSEAGREYADRTDQAAVPAPRRKPPIGEVPVDKKLKFADIREKWNSLSAEGQEKAMQDGDLVVEASSKEKTA